MAAGGIEGMSPEEAKKKREKSNVTLNSLAGKLREKSPESRSEAVQKLERMVRETGEPDIEGGETTSSLTKALIPAITTGVGYLFGGLEGGAAGANIGGKAVGDISQAESAGLRERKLASREKKKQEFDLAKFQIQELGRQEEKTEKKVEKVAESTQKLRKERSNLDVTKNTQKVAQAFNRIEASAKSPSPAGDLALIFNYMKMLDPGSVVRESEFRTAAQAGALPERAQAAYDRIAEGKLLSPAMRNDFVLRAQKLMGAQQNAQTQIDTQYKQFAKQAGIDPSQVIVSLSPAQASQVQEQIQAMNPDQQIGIWDKIKQSVGISEQQAQAAPVTPFKDASDEDLEKMMFGE